MSNDHDPARLLSEIILDPDNMDLRQAYAAAIAPSDPERAEYVRLSLETIEAAQLADPDMGSRLKLNQLRKLLGENRGRWIKALAPHVRNAEFWRGFVEMATVSAQSFIASGERLVTMAPIQHLDVHPWGGVDARRFCGMQALARMKSLVLASNGLRDDFLEALVQSPYVANLRYISLRSNGFTKKGVRLLAESANFPSLRWVDLSNTDFPASDTVFVFEDGSVSLPIVADEAREIEAEIGRRVPWLHYPTPPTCIWDMHPNPFRL